MNEQRTFTLTLVLNAKQIDLTLNALDVLSQRWHRSRGVSGDEHSPYDIIGEMIASQVYGVEPATRPGRPSKGVGDG